MLFSGKMAVDRSDSSAHHTPVLLVEADSYARLRHEIALRAAGYEVRAFTDHPGPADLHHAALVLTDLPAFHSLYEVPARRLPPIVVLVDDNRAGVTACLHGAAAWAPTDGKDDYLIDTVEGILRHGHPTLRAE